MGSVLPDVTVLMPVYNASQFLSRAIESVFKQTYQAWSLVIVDDASNDGSTLLLEEFRSHPDIHIVNLSQNVGQGRALNIGLGHVASPYFVQLDADDWFEPQALEVLLAFAVQQPPDVSMVHGNMAIWFDPPELGSEARRIVRKGRNFTNPVEVLSYGPTVCPRMYRTSAVRAVGGWPTDDPFDGRIMEDKLLMGQLIERGRFAWVDKLLYNHRRHSTNHTDIYRAQYNRLIKWFVKKKLADWEAPYRPEFRKEDGWVLTELVPEQTETMSSPIPPYTQHQPDRRTNYTVEGRTGIAHPQGSVVVPTYNQCRRLELCLASLQTQTIHRPTFEVIVVDDGSTDKTLEVARKYLNRLPLRLVSLERNVGRAAARNVGIQQARGDIIVFIDGDIIVPSNFVKSHLEGHQNHEKRVVTGALAWGRIWTYLDPGLPQHQLGEFAEAVRNRRPLARRAYVRLKSYGITGHEGLMDLQETVQLVDATDVLRNRVWQFTYTPTWAQAYTGRIHAQHGNRLEGYGLPWVTFITGNCSVRKNFLLQAGGFDERFRNWGLEDYELGYRLHKLGADYYSDPSLREFHQNHRTDKSNREQSTAHNYALFLQRHQDLPIFLLSVAMKDWNLLHTVGVAAYQWQQLEGRSKLSLGAQKFCSHFEDAAHAHALRFLRRANPDLVSPFSEARHPLPADLPSPSYVPKEFGELRRVYQLILQGLQE